MDAQPIDTLMTQLGIRNKDLVEASREQLNFKDVNRGRSGQPLAPKIQDKILHALLALKPELELARRDLFRYEMDSGAIEGIDQAFALIGAKKIKYPEFVDHLLKAGVTRYSVDIAAHQMTFYGTGGEAHVRQALALELAPSGQYDLDAIKRVIADAQADRIDHPTFLQRIYAAGVKTYEANLRSREIRYKGETMSYKEDIPVVGAAPKPAAPPKPRVASRKAPKKKKSHRVNVANSLKARKAAKKRSWNRK